MSRWQLSGRRSARAHVWGLGAQRLAWLQGGAPAAAAHADALTQAAKSLEAGQQVHVIAANELAVHWLQQPPAATQSLQELRQVASARCARLYGGAPEDWWIAGDWSATRPFVCAGLRRSATTAIEQAVAERGARATWHTAWAVASAAHANNIPDDGWSAIRSPRRVLLWHCSGGQVDALGSVAVEPDASAAQVETQARLQMQLEALAGPADAAGSIHWVARTAPHGTDPCEALAALHLRVSLQGAMA